MDAPTYLTTQAAAAALGVTDRQVRRMCAAGEIPGALRLSGTTGPWRVPAAAVTADSPSKVTESPAGAVAHTPAARTMPTRYVSLPDQSSHHLVSTAVSAAHLLAHVPMNRPARALSTLTLDVAAAASRHQPDRDHRCAHCGWTWPCPDARDLTTALDTMLATLRDGVSA